jgi:4-amino-4-deoxy-L-arabinose transferase-like glycosyltransferase
MGPRRRWVDALLLALLVGIGAGLCFHQLDRLPPRTNSDEYTTAVEIFEILHGTGPPLFGFDWKPMPALTTHATALIMRVVGPSLVALRLFSVLLGLLAAVLLYVVLRRQCSALVAFAAGLVLVSNPWFLNFARSGWENGHIGTYWLLFTCCFLAALNAPRRSWLYCAGAGVGLALSLYGYFSGRLLLVCWALFFLVAARASWVRQSCGDGRVAARDHDALSDSRRRAGQRALLTPPTYAVP